MEVAGGLDAREDELPERRILIGHFLFPWLVEGRSSMAPKSWRLFEKGPAAGNRRGENLATARLWPMAGDEASGTAMDKFC
jgi:hypothetical protein